MSVALQVGALATAWMLPAIIFFETTYTNRYGGKNVTGYCYRVRVFGCGEGRRDKGRWRRQMGGLVLVRVLVEVLRPHRTIRTHASISLFPLAMMYYDVIVEVQNFNRTCTRKRKMGYDPEKHHRRSIRLKDYNYSQPGMYFVTMCCWQRQRLFDEPEVRQIAIETWHLLPNRFPTLTMDIFVVMPDHVHGILQLNSPIRQTKAPRLDEIIRVYKSMTSVHWLQLNKQRGTPCTKHLWQERFYDHVIRNEKDAQRIQEYILNNPLKPDLLQGKDIDEQIWEEIINRAVFDRSGESSR